MLRKFGFELIEIPAEGRYLDVFYIHRKQNVFLE